MEILVILILLCATIGFILLLVYTSDYRDTIYVLPKNDKFQYKITQYCKIKKDCEFTSGVIYMELKHSFLYVMEEEEFFKTFITLKEYERRQSKPSYRRVENHI